MPELRADGLYHLITPADWETARLGPSIEPDSLRTEGFVHCSWGHQVPGTLERHFAGAGDVLALRLDQDRFGDLSLIEEGLTSAGPFPHLYGPLPVAAIVEVVAVRGGAG